MARSLTGRPQRAKMINFRVSSAEFTELLTAANAQKLSVSEFCREAIISGATSRTPAAGGRMTIDWKARAEAADAERDAIARQNADLRAALGKAAEGQCLYSATADGSARCQECGHCGIFSNDILHSGDCVTGQIESALTLTPPAVNGRPAITVDVQAIDSQPFMDQRTEIALAMREAMLEADPHPTGPNLLRQMRELLDQIERRGLYHTDYCNSQRFAKRGRDSNTCHCDTIMVFSKIDQMRAAIAGAIKEGGQ